MHGGARWGSNDVQGKPPQLQGDLVFVCCAKRTLRTGTVCEIVMMGKSDTFGSLRTYFMLMLLQVMIRALG